MPECTRVPEYQSETVDSFRLYPRVISKESNPEPNMEETETSFGNC